MLFAIFMASLVVKCVCVCGEGGRSHLGDQTHTTHLCHAAGHRIPQGIGSGAFYSATKHAVRVLCEGLRQEARAAGVPLRVSMVSPGLVHTDFFSAMSGGDAATVERCVECNVQTKQCVE
jgi:NADP-dependent 3-hydroxy acid dehydrogenase YdfG